MDARRAEAMHGYFLAAQEMERAEGLAEGVTLAELDALAALPGLRFAPEWAVAAYGGGQ